MRLRLEQVTDTATLKVGQLVAFRDQVGNVTVGRVAENPRERGAYIDYRSLGGEEMRTYVTKGQLTQEGVELARIVG